MELLWLLMQNESDNYSDVGDPSECPEPDPQMKDHEERGVC